MDLANNICISSAEQVKVGERARQLRALLASAEEPKLSSQHLHQTVHNPCNFSTRQANECPLLASGATHAQTHTHIKKCIHFLKGFKKKAKNNSLSINITEMGAGEWLHWFFSVFSIYPLYKYSVKANYMPNTVLGAENTAVIQADKPSCLPEHKCSTFEHK